LNVILAKVSMPVLRLVQSQNIGCGLEFRDSDEAYLCLGEFCIAGAAIRNGEQRYSSYPGTVLENIVVEEKRGRVGYEPDGG
jgi:hypothetical protein